MLILSGPARALEVPGPLVDSEWLAQHLDSVKILDVRADIESFTRRAVLERKRFTGDLVLKRPGAHIPGAVLVDAFNILSSREINGRNVRFLVTPKAEFETLMQSWGINSGDAIVVTNMGASSAEMTLVTRLYWQIKYFGHDNVAVLDGGVGQWLVEEREASIGESRAGPGNWRAGRINRAILATSEEVAAAVENKSAQLLDTRSLEYYLGHLKKRYVRRRGHIPGAKVFPSGLLTSENNGVYFTDPEDIRAMARALGVDVDAPTITYCNSGQLASAGWFVFSELLGNNRVKLYDGSMHQWALEKRPVVKMKME